MGNLLATTKVEIDLLEARPLFTHGTHPVLRGPSLLGQRYENCRNLVDHMARNRFSEKLMSHVHEQTTARSQ
ncbi:hypothetical protein RRG08_053097 [Elysia crispata]|uniref:Uncharacterized protein n=1 Tax=Elysia crispata TaxID=231223 RepID=A0AAE0Y283_9GAST|nr:hypothetical protein RRG08_053097 [Elysia crispata]